MEWKKIRAVATPDPGARGWPILLIETEIEGEKKVYELNPGWGDTLPQDMAATASKAIAHYYGEGSPANDDVSTLGETEVVWHDVRAISVPEEGVPWEVVLLEEQINGQPGVYRLNPSYSEAKVTSLEAAEAEIAERYRVHGITGKPKNPNRRF